MEITNEEQYHTAKQRFDELDRWIEQMGGGNNWGVQQLEIINEYSDLNSALALYESRRRQKGNTIKELSKQAWSFGKSFFYFPKGIQY